MTCFIHKFQQGNNTKSATPPPDQFEIGRTLKILFLNYEFPPIGGGGANATKYLFKEFSAVNGLEIDLVTSAWQDPGVEEFSPDIRVHKLDIHKKKLHYWTHREIIEYLIKAYRYTYSLVKDVQPDICHAFFGFPSGLVAYLLRDKLPYIVSLRGSDVPGFNNRFSLEYLFLTPLFKKIWRQSRRVIANSRGLKSLALQTAPEQDIDVIFNGIDIEEFRPKTDSGPGDKQINLITVSRLIERKGLDYLIRSMPEIQERDPRVTLTIIGEGNLEEELKSLSNNLGVSDHVTFLGFQDHSKMPAHYNNAHIFLLPSKNEGMSNTILEAMACGLPIVTTQTGGTGELIEGNGIIVPMEDSHAIAQAVLKITADPDLMRGMGEKSRRTAEEFGWHEQAMKYVDIYNANIGDH